MTLLGQHIAVIGAGIGGLAVARALALRGAEVTLLEQAAEITEVGAGIQISPNGLAVIRALGLETSLRATGTPRARGVTLRDATGRVVTRLDLSGTARPEDYLFVHRADLIDVLARGARDAGVAIRLLQHVDRVTPASPTNLRPDVHMSQGAHISADLVIGADGINSCVRPLLNSAAAPQFTGQVAWRAVVPGDDGPNEAQIFMGPGRHLVTYPLRGGLWRNIVAVQEQSEWVPQRWSHRDEPENLQDAFANMCPRARAILARVSDVHLWGLFRHPVASHWYGNNLAILGDAAHPTLPFLAQGASMALEDAWALAQALAGAEDTTAGLAMYQQRRHARVTRVINAANGNAWKYHLRGPMAAAAHLGMRMAGAIAPNAITRSFAWLYDYDVTADP